MWASNTRDGTASGRRWQALRAHILKRDPQCQLTLDGCTGRSTEVDHIISVKDGGNHRPDNLRGVCNPCHKTRTQSQAQAGRERRQRPTEQHPGLL